MTRSIKGMLFLFGAFTLAGTSVVSARFLSGRLGTFTITALSLAFALLLLLPLCRGRLAAEVRGMAAGEKLRILLQALFGIFLFRMFLLSGLARTTAAEAGILTGATPAITAILAVALLRERVHIKNVAGVAGTVCGVLLVQGALAGGLDASHFWGNILVLCAAASESAFNIFSRVSALKSGQRQADPIVITALVTCAAFVMCLVPALFEAPLQRIPELAFTEWLALVWYGAAATALAFICWYSGIRRCGAFAAAAFSGMMPLTSLLLSVALLGERPEWHQWLGGALIVFGMVLIGTGQVRKKEKPLDAELLLPERHRG
jgi:drug/metabolite transporter (DMT)-like permease